MNRALLEVRGLTRSFGAMRAVDDINFDVLEGTITGLIGPNGAGKSTAFGLITGAVRADDASRGNGSAACRLIASFARDLPARFRFPGPSRK